MKKSEIEDLSLLELAIKRDENTTSYRTKEEFFKECNIDDSLLQSLPDLEME